MRYTTIGSGSAVPQERRSAPCHLLQASGQNVVVDLGPGAVWGLLRLGGVSPVDIGLVLLTHLHMDHCADLAPLLFSLRSRELERTAPLRVIGPPGLRAHFAALNEIWEHRIEPSGFDLSVEEWRGGAIKWQGLAIDGAPTRHSVANLAWRVDEPGRMPNGVIITGDGRSTSELIALGRAGEHVLIAESAAGPREDLQGHMNPAQAGRLAARCGSSRLVLSHINPGSPAEEFLGEAGAHFGGAVRVAEDGMLIEIA